MDIVIRDATPEDVPAMLSIYNEVLLTSTAIFSDILRSLDEQRRWYLERRDQGKPVLVATLADAVVGYCSYGPFRTWPGYRHTVENSIYLASAVRGRGIGTHLLAALVQHADAQGIHAIIAGIDGENISSMKLHAKLGFVEVARLREVGRKFDRWLDLVFYERLAPANVP